MGHVSDMDGNGTSLLERGKCVKKILGTMLAVCIALVSAGETAKVPEWKQQSGQYVLTSDRGTFTCDRNGWLSLKANNQPPLEIGLFFWHDAYVYETLAGGKVESQNVEGDGSLCLRGLWGAREGAAPVRYSLRLTPAADQVAVRLEVEKTAALKLTDGIWAAIQTVVATNETRCVYLSPCADSPLGRNIDGAFQRTLVGQEEGQAVFFCGDGLCRLRSRFGGNRHIFEVKFSRWRDFPAGEKRTVLMTFGWNDLPKIRRARISDRSALTLSAEAPREVPLYGRCNICGAARHVGQSV